MRLQGRNLQAGMAGDDVSALHHELVALGYEVPPGEQEAKAFGVATAGTVARLQRAHGLPDTAVVDEATARALERALTSPSAETVVARLPLPERGTPAPPPAAVGRQPVVVPTERTPAPPPAADTEPLTDDLAVVHRALDALGVEVDEAERAAGRLGPSTQAAITRMQLLAGVEPTGRPDPTTMVLARAALTRLGEPTGVQATADGSWVVSGAVTDPEGQPLVGVTVTALAQQLREAVPLGTGVTDRAGQYRISYPPPDRSVDGTGLALRLHVSTAEGKPLFGSPVHYQVPPEAEILLALGGPDRARPAEYAELAQQVAMRLGGLRPEELVERDDIQDLSFLAGDTGLPKPSIAFYSVAARLARDTELPAELFYALLREGVPADAEVGVLASRADAGVDLDTNGQQLLRSLLAASPDARRRAVESAVAGHVLPPGYAARAEKDLQQLDRLAVDAALTTPAGMGKTPLAEVLSAVEVPADRQRDFMTRYLAAEVPDRKFWQDLASSDGFDPAEVATLRFGTEVGYLTRGHLPLLAALAGQRRQGRIGGARDLARLSAADWRSLLLDPDQGPIGIPANFAAATPQAAVDAYAHLLERNFERRFPTTAFAARLAEDRESPFPAAEQTVQFLEGHPGFSLPRTNVDRYLKDNPEVLAGPDRAQVREALLLGQRLVKLAPRYAVVKPLRADGIGSAQQVFAMGRDRFVGRYAEHPDIGATQAARVYAVAEQTYALALALALQFNAPMRGFGPIVTEPAPLPAAPAPAPPAPPAPPAEPEPAPPTTLDALPLDEFASLRTLFGSLDMCACRHCRSVLSPAAYLTDMLQFLSHRISNGASAKQVLLTRRPDLAQIELNCRNTDTVLPYLDLVNELLEDAVAPPADPVAAARARQTTLTTDELNAHPEHVNQAAYATLAGAVFPWRLPFDLPLAEARTYLEMLGTDRVSLMRSFQRLAIPPAAAAAAIAVEALGMPATEADLVTGGPAAAGQDPWQIWGLAETGNTEPDPLDHTITVSGTWLDVLSYLRILLDRAGLDYRALTRLFATRFVNPAGAVQIHCDPPESCDLADMTVTGLDPAVLDRLHRFIRLQRRLGWSVHALDSAIELLQAGTPAGVDQLNPTLLRQLVAVTVAMRRFRIPAPAAVAMLARVETRGAPALPGEPDPDPSLYAQLFANRTVRNPVDPIFALNPAGTEIDAIAAGPRLADHRATLLGAFELRDDDLLYAIEQLTEGALTLANLSTLYRHVLLARGLGLSIRELVSLRALVEVAADGAPPFLRVDPFDATQPESLAAFTEQVDRLRKTAFSTAELDYLLRHVAEPGSGVAPDEVAVGTLLRSVRDKLIQVAAEHAQTPDPTGTEVRRRLATLLPPSDVDALGAVLAGTSPLAEPDQEALIGSRLAPYLDDPAGAQAALVGAAALAPGEQRYQYLLTRLLAYLRRTLGTGLVVQELADVVGLPPATTAELTGWLPAASDPGQPVLVDFLALPGIVRDPAKEAEPVDRQEPGFGPYFGRYAALAKAALVVAGFGLTTDELAWLRAHGTAEGWLDPTALPAAATPHAQGRFLRWRRLADAVALRTGLPSDGTPVTGLMDLARGGASKADYLTALRERTRWPAESLRVLAGDPANPADPGLLGLAYPEAYQSERALHRLTAGFTLLRRLGIAADVSGWLSATVTTPPAGPITQPVADALRQSVKAKYPASRWAAVAKPPRDRLREQQRDALLGHLLAHPPAGVARWSDPSDVYAHYLIDVETSACQGTSRIVQANATVQLFVQRCLLNLEPAVTADADVDADWRQWQWISRYRVWEANRRVFLHPENWIDPALRREKSPFFTELENELLQGEVTRDTAEAAYRGYLEKLAAVSRLEVVGTYHQASNPPVLHVFGRKQGQPPTYYYRQWIDSSRWTAWQKVELDITGEHLLPVVWNRRLYLFWATVTREPDREQARPAMALSGGPPPEARVHTEVRLSWSEFRDGKWQPTQTAPQTLAFTFDRHPSEVLLKSSLGGPELRIGVYSRYSTNRTHFADFVLGGAGNAVEVYGRFTTDLEAIGPHTAGIGQLPPALQLGGLSKPTNSTYRGMALAPGLTEMLTPARPRVAPCHVSYDHYGTLVSEVVLNRADRYRLVIPHQTLWFDSTLPFFYEDSKRSYFVIPVIYYQDGNYFSTTPPAYVYKPTYQARYTFAPFYHAFVPLLLRELDRGGLDALFDRKLQLNPAQLAGGPAFSFTNYYLPTNKALLPRPTEGIDFARNAGYALYNWELFFHGPFQIGRALSRNQRFAEAKRWYEYVFNPASTTGDPIPQRYWVTKPFYQMTKAEYLAQSIQRLMHRINQGDPEAEHQVAQWRADPFDPHLIAGLRPVAYQRAIVMAYLDNLIAWGDQLFRQDTLESVNEATQLYVLAAELLGPRPELIPPRAEPPVKTYAELEPELDGFANAIAAAENALSPVKVNVPSDPSTPKLPVLPPLYFCVPPNENLLRYWDTVADRLYKVRHCLNIEGVARQLALFAPPIDPGLLVRATAAGLDLGSVLNDTSAALPPYRFRVVIRHALELADSVRALGAELLAVLEKRDLMALELLRAGAEKKLQDRIRDLRTWTVEEAEQQLEVLAKHRLVLQERRDYFGGIKDEMMNTWEAAAQIANAGSMVAEALAIVLNSTSGTAHALPDAQFGGSGAGGSPHATVKIGGKNAGNAASGWATAARVAAAVLQTTAAMSQVMGGYQRRKEEWDFQYRLAGREQDHVDAQTVATEIRRDIATREKGNHEIVAELAASVDELLHDRFTNRELYEWMIAQTSASYFQAYQLAFTVARRAEQCLRHELGLADSSYIQFGYWDSLRKGLLTADKLRYDLQRMEAAYYEQHTRELELTRHVSLLELDPHALVELRSTGQCTVHLPELLFDLDNPGHYQRRLKTVAVTVPCVVGPYTGVPLTVTLLESSVRTTTDPSPQYARSPGDDSRFADDLGGVEAVVTSGGQQDAGLFEPRLDDERYLPFERAGVISTWQLRLNPVFPQFDYATIADVVLHLRYTARDGGALLAQAAANHARDTVNAAALASNRQGLFRLVDAPSEHPDRWHRFLHPDADTDQLLVLPTPPDLFPFFTTGLEIKVAGLDLLGRLADPGDYTVEITPPGGAPQEVPMPADPTLGGLHHATIEPLNPKPSLGRALAPPPHPQWQLRLRRSGAADFRSLDPDEVRDLVLVFRYEVTP
jgi:peptidoglycan hydrolase-like protein with peptidoglycan-binding domain